VPNKAARFAAHSLFYGVARAGEQHLVALGAIGHQPECTARGGLHVGDLFPSPKPTNGDIFTSSPTEVLRYTRTRAARRPRCAPASRSFFQLLTNAMRGRTCRHIQGFRESHAFESRSVALALYACIRRILLRNRGCACGPSVASLTAVVGCIGIQRDLSNLVQRICGSRCSRSTSKRVSLVASEIRGPVAAINPKIVLQLAQRRHSARIKPLAEHPIILVLETNAIRR
jgi:hypothetical protein